MPSLFSSGDLYSLAAMFPERQDVQGMALAALGGDEGAEWGLYDWCQEEGIMQDSFKVGCGYLIQTATLYYCGEVVRETFSHVYLKTASWVHWTGRLGTLLRLARGGKTFASAFPSGERRPRTEFLGEYRVWKQSIVGDGEVPVTSLPQEAIQ